MERIFSARRSYSDDLGAEGIGDIERSIDSANCPS
jgi:hypothetical protein